MVFSLALKDDMLINQAVILLPSNQQTRTRLKFTILFPIAHRLVFTTLHGKVIFFLGTCTRRLTGPHAHFLLACRDGHLLSGLCLACRDGHLPSGLCLACRDGHQSSGLCPGLQPWKSSQETAVLPDIKIIMRDSCFARH